MSSSRFHIVEHINPCQHIREYAGGTKRRQEDVLNLAIKQYIPNGSLEPRQDAVTIVAAHANGFPKEVYEPLWDEVLALSKKLGFQIRSIWAADTSHQGASGILNEYSQGDDPSWFDHSRDLLLMINQFREQMPRPIMGIGHSMGAAELVNLSIMHPRLLTTLVLIEPVIQREPPPEMNLAAMSTFRPDLWPSRTAAEAAFRKSRFFAPWDSRALDKYLEYGLREVPTAVYPPSQSSEGAVTLATTKHQEVWTYLRPNFEPQGPKGHPSKSDHLLSPDLDPEVEGTYLFHRPEPAIILNLLPFLRPSALYMFGGKSALSGSAAQAQKMECTGAGIGGSGGAQTGRVKKVVFENGGHMLPCEEVAGCAEVVATWLAAELERFKAEEQFWAHHDSGKSERDMLTLSRKWQQLIRLPPNSQRPVKEKL